MDPNANLRELLDLARALILRPEASICDSIGPESIDAHRLAELVLVLDEWIQHGGFLPGAWAKKGS